ncbi:elongation factor P--(R)-beta-lysine ligase [Leptospira wolffii]|uniref:amino acid--tRNA ligase-related protein n=1 Tax=Leptospira wolffii TaxID=409998 RepID=UPI00108464E9|nr:amino acid--tRNA ligase-related protein [Leptospira wolffii]TGL47448.1 elongation factor P--(R)-beta-lysine ligase [Leptospira wolffii]
MNLTNLQTLILRSKFLQSVRKFFTERDFLEIDTPALKRVGGMEPYLDPFGVLSPSMEEKGYLITSPEYSLKQALSLGVKKVYEIAHTFRSGERGSSYHTAEFLMLEFYQSNVRLEGAMDLIFELISDISYDIGKPIIQPKFNRWKVKELLTQFAQLDDWNRNSLEKKIRELKLTGLDLNELTYEDCFYLVFLNLVEPKLPSEFTFIYDYPPEMAALSKIEDGCAKRFELYFGNIELSNSFYELQDVEEQRKRFSEEQRLRQKLGKEVFPMNKEFLFALERGIPECTGVSIGLDRLFMVILGLNSLEEVSPYWNQI